MDPMDVMREYLAAKEEHERALAAISAAQQQLETARSDFADARQVELQMEEELQRATAKVAAGLQEMHLVESDAEAERTPVLPAVSDFLVEYHRNIGCYHCYVFVSDDNGGYAQLDGTQFKIQVKFPFVKLLMKPRSASAEGGVEHAGGDDSALGELWWSTEIERNVDQAKCVIDVKADHIYVRLPVKEGDKDVIGDGFSSFSQITSKELDKSHYNRIMCRGCDNVLAQATAENPIERVLPLPSANWMDMFDFWGAGLGAFEHLPREDIFAQVARMYVGEAHILLHESNTNLNALENVPAASATATGQQEEANASEEEDSKSFWQSLRCSKCAAEIGMRHKENPQTIRLHKHLLASSQSTAGDGAAEEKETVDIFARYTVDSVVCAKLLEFTDSDGVFRFTLCTSEHAALQLQLLSWETLVKDKRSPEFRRVLKVLFAPALEQSGPSGSLQFAAPAQDLVFAPAICETIAFRLKESSRLLPLSLRRFNKMDVGYLYA
ncbi:E3 ubiquitin-protein ligase e3d [Globisporangium polare]